ncbi:MAG: hypothetical protein WCO68_00435 [Verrucomicrobiota bacterium]
MKTYSILLALLVGGLALARAQEAPAPGSLAEPMAPTLQTPDLMLAPIPPPPAATPAPEAPAPALVTPPVALQKGTAEQLRQAIRIRELRTLAEEDPAVIAQKTTAQCAKTEAGRCVAMRNYYTLLYTQMEKLDPTLRPLLETQLHNTLIRYEQHNVRPTELIEQIASLPGSSSADHTASTLPDEAPAKKKAQNH